MVHTMTAHGAPAGIGRFLEHTAAIVVGLILMIVGLGLGVTMIMLPVGIVIGLGRFSSSPTRASDTRS
jgi:hypothetical protein